MVANLLLKGFGIFVLNYSTFHLIKRTCIYILGVYKYQANRFAYGMGFSNQ